MAEQTTASWYIVQAMYDDIVKTRIETQVRKQGFCDRIFQVWVPGEVVRNNPGTTKLLKLKSEKVESFGKPTVIGSENGNWGPRSPEVNTSLHKRGGCPPPGEEWFGFKFYAGYVLVKMILTPETYWFIRTIEGVTGFLGDPNPAPVPEEEINFLLEKTNNNDGNPKYLIEFKPGESVRITEGPFKHFIGVVEEVNKQKNKLKVMVTVFDRTAPVEVDFLQVEKN